MSRCLPLSNVLYNVIRWTFVILKHLKLRFPYRYTQYYGVKYLAFHTLVKSVTLVAVAPRLHSHNSYHQLKRSQSISQYILDLAIVIQQRRDAQLVRHRFHSWWYQQPVAYEWLMRLLRLLGFITGRFQSYLLWHKIKLKIWESQFSQYQNNWQISQKHIFYITCCIIWTKRFCNMCIHQITWWCVCLRVYICILIFRKQLDIMFILLLYKPRESNILRAYQHMFRFISVVFVSLENLSGQVCSVLDPTIVLCTPSRMQVECFLKH